MMATSESVEELCKKLKPVIGKKADALWHMYLTEDEKGRETISEDVEIIAERVLKTPSLSRDKILLPPSSMKDSKGEFLIGDAVYNDKELHSVGLQEEDFVKQIGIFGITGEGKTNLAYSLAIQLLQNKVPWLIIDWKRSWRSILSLKDQYPELKDVQVYTVGRDILPLRWNQFRAPPDADKEQWLGAIADALEESHLSGQGVAYHFTNIYKKLMKKLPEGFYPNFFDGLKEIETLKVTQRELMWKQSAQRIFQSFTTGAASKAFNTRNPIKLEDLLDKPVILELDMEMPKPLRVFFTEMILRWLHLYRISQGETDKLKHVLFLEECHNLFHNQLANRDTNNSLETVYREIRAFSQGIVSITQHPALLPLPLLGNCHTQIYFGLQHALDIQAARKSLFLKYEEESYPNLLKVGECILKVKNRLDPCLLKTPLVPVRKGVITDQWLRKNMPPYLLLQKQVNNLLSAPDSSKSVSESASKSPDKKEEKKGKQGNTKTNADKLLEDVFLHPLSSVTERYKRLKLNPKYGNHFKKQLIADKCIIARTTLTARYRIVLFDLTNKGKATLRDLGHNIPNEREGIVHKFWKYRIADYYKKQGYKVEVEKPTINGRADIIIQNQDGKTAIEIETGKSDMIGNIRKRLDGDFDEVISVATNKSVEDKIRKQVAERGIGNEKVKVMNVLGLTEI